MLIKHTTFLVLVFLMALMGPGEPRRLATASEMTAAMLQEQGHQQYQHGAFPDAIVSWGGAARRFGQDGQKREQAQALGQLAQALAQVGQYLDAGTALADAIPLARKLDDRAQVASLLGQLGTVQFALGLNTDAQKTFQEALALVQENQITGLTGSLLNDLGNVLAAEDQPAQAVKAYTEAATAAQVEKHTILAATATLNAAHVFIQAGHLNEGKGRLDRVAESLHSLPPSHDQAFAWISLGLAFEGLQQGGPPTEKSRFEGAGPVPAPGSRKIILKPGELTRAVPADTLGTPSSAPVAIVNEVVLRQAAEAYWAAQQSATAIDDALAESYAWGYLGHLYETQGREEEALSLTRRAIGAAQGVRAPESLYRWHWQTARLLKRQRHIPAAILAYRRAIATLQPIRQEFLVGSRSRQLSFRETTGPLFFELSDLLLQQATATIDRQMTQELLVQAQDTVELFKAAELQDYFSDECVTMAQSRSTTVAEQTHNTAIVYPIVLPERLELLVSLPSGLRQVVVSVPAEAITREARAFRLALEDRRTTAYLTHGTQLYDWLIRPVAAALEAEHITTLVFVPDGALRTIPMAPLFDGKDYLINKFALAIIPGLTLTDARPLNRGKMKLLSAGLSESVQGFPPLPSVAKELTAIQHLYGGTMMMNDQFLVGKMQEDLKKEPFTILHIASHGTVEKDVKKSFILAYDGKITMDRLSELVGVLQFREAPLELLTLSACETAAGDDRAALGLAGVAIKAGARSAVATLWPVDDDATAKLIQEFYTQLQDPGVSKAVALQRAQVKILAEPEHQHPSFWAPYLLINNWL